MTKADVCDMLVRSVGLKDFVYDIAAADTGVDTIDIDPLAGYVHDTSALAQQIRKDYGLWQDFLA